MLVVKEEQITVIFGSHFSRGFRVDLRSIHPGDIMRKENSAHRQIMRRGNSEHGKNAHAK